MIYRRVIRVPDGWKRKQKIREQAGHAENSPAFWGYIREADKWTDAASEDIGL